MNSVPNSVEPQQTPVTAYNFPGNFNSDLSRVHIRHLTENDNDKTTLKV